MAFRFRLALAVGALALLGAPSHGHGQATDRELPAAIPLFPLPDVTLFPSSTQPFHIFEPRYRAMIADALAGDSIIGMVALQPGFETDYDGRPPVYSVGCAGVIVAAEQLPDGRYDIVLRAVGKFRITEEDEGRAYRLAVVESVAETGPEEVDAELLAQRRRQLEAALRGAYPGASLPSASLADAEFVDAVSLVLPVDPPRRQELLEADGPLARASALMGMLRGGARI